MMMMCAHDRTRMMQRAQMSVCTKLTAHIGSAQRHLANLQALCLMAEVPLVDTRNLLRRFLMQVADFAGPSRAQQGLAGLSGA